MNSDGLAFLGRLHPLLVHVPIGLMVGVVVLEVGSWFRADLGGARRILSWAAVVAASVAALCGWWRAQEGSYDAETLGDHRWMGIGFAVSVLITVLLERFRAGRGLRWRQGALWFSAALMVVAGHHGGVLARGDRYLTEFAPAWLVPVLEHESEGARSSLEADQRDSGSDGASIVETLREDFGARLEVGPQGDWDVDFSGRAAGLGVEAMQALRGAASRVTALSLAGRSLAPAALRAVPPLPRLIRLDAGSTDLGDADLGPLFARTPALRDLNLSGTQVTDTGLSALEVLRSLATLDLSETAVTPAAVLRLRARRPALDVVSAPANQR